MIYNWKSTRNRHFDVDIRVNYVTTIKADRTPKLQRYNAPLNLASNAFLRQQMKVKKTNLCCFCVNFCLGFGLFNSPLWA